MSCLNVIVAVTVDAMTAAWTGKDAENMDARAHRSRTTRARENDDH